MLEPWADLISGNRSACQVCCASRAPEPVLDRKRVPRALQFHAESADPGFTRHVKALTHRFARFYAPTDHGVRNRVVIMHRQNLPVQPGGVKKKDRGNPAVSSRALFAP